MHQLQFRFSYLALVPTGVSAHLQAIGDEMGDCFSQVSVNIPETCGAVKGGRVGPGRTWTQERPTCRGGGCREGWGSLGQQ